MRKEIKEIAVFALLVAGSGWGLIAAAPGAVSVLVGAEAESGRIVFCRPLPASGFTLAFDHSMYGGEVRERFVAVAGRAIVRRVETTTANEAAAEYYAYDAPVVADGARFRVEVPPLDLPELVVRVDRVGGHRLLIGAERLELLPLVGERRPLRLTIEGVEGDGPAVRAGCRRRAGNSPPFAGEAG